MTRQRNDEHSTELGLWLRQQPAIDSKLGFVATNIDYLWSNYKTKQWLLIEEKRYGRKPAFSQRQLSAILNKVAQYDKNYCGFYLVVFENTSPLDGLIWINHKEANADSLTKLLRFDVPTLKYYQKRAERG